MRQRQQGVALISVLFVFALVTVIASEILSKSYLSIRRTANDFDSRQAYYYALAGESLARQHLGRDNDSEDNAVDHFNEIWAQDFSFFNIDEGVMQVNIVDAQGYFNLNNLVDEEGVVRPQAVQQFQQLLNVLSLDSDIADSVVDWIDKDSDETANGAEDNYYRSQQRRYLSANTLMADRTELRLLKAVGADSYQQLKPFVVALPLSTHYNLNTIKPEVLRALSEELSESDAESVHQQQRRGGYDSVRQWLDTEELPALNALQDSLSVSSQYFEIQVVAQFRQRLSRLRTLVYRDPEEGTLQVIKRQSDSELFFEE